MCLDSDSGVLSFLVDGKPHGPGHTGVIGKVQWAVSVYYRHNSVEIVPTQDIGVPAA